MLKCGLLLLVCACMVVFCECDSDDGNVKRHEKEDSPLLDEIILFLLKNFILAQNNKTFNLDVVEVVIKYYERIERMKRLLQKMNSTKNKLVKLTNFLRF